MPKIVGEAFMETKEGLIIGFHLLTDLNSNPLEEVAEFDQGDHWSIDACGNEAVENTYPPDPEDDSFVLIPKTSVVRVWNEPKNGPKMLTPLKLSDVIARN